MAVPKIHFIYDPHKQPDASFAAQLIAGLGQVRNEDADHIVSIGGDGILLHTLYCAQGRKVMGVIPPTSNSNGFWTNKDIQDVDTLLGVLATSRAYPVDPLQADIMFADGEFVTRYGYNEISLSPVPQTPTAALKDRFNLSDIDVSVQSLLLNLRVSFANAVLGPSRIMGSGLIFSTPLGSTAMNRNFGGPAVDIRNAGIILTSMGRGYLAREFTPVHNSPDTVFHVEIKSQDKRPAMVTFDSFGVAHNVRHMPIAEVRISTARGKTAHIVLADDPGRRAYSAMMP